MFDPIASSLVDTTHVFECILAGLFDGRTTLHFSAWSGQRVHPDRTSQRATILGDFKEVADRNHGLGSRLDLRNVSDQGRGPEFRYGNIRSARIFLYIHRGRGAGARSSSPRPRRPRGHTRRDHPSARNRSVRVGTLSDECLYGSWGLLSALWSCWRPVDLWLHRRRPWLALSPVPKRQRLGLVLECRGD